MCEAGHVSAARSTVGPSRGRYLQLTENYADQRLGAAGDTELEQPMSPRQVLCAASRNRLRPITVTTLAAIFKLLPLALASRQGFRHAAATRNFDFRRACVAAGAD
jgi:hypothetical protein